MTKEFQKAVHLVVYNGRFQPLHDGHKNVFKKGFELAEVVVAAVGSVNCPSDTRNPFPFEIRKQMLIDTFRDEYNSGRLVIIAINDHTYENGAWRAELIEKVSEVAANKGFTNPTIGLLGFKKDDTSDYLDWFPEWKSLLVDEQFGILNASDLREPLLTEGVILKEHLNSAVVRIIKRWMRTKTYRRLVTEMKEIRHVRSTYGAGPFLTSDAVIEHRGHILAIIRGGRFGYGLTAFPGGINDGEEPIDCMIRELDEEVGLFKLNSNLTPELLKSFIVHSEVFDSPRRDGRGHYIAHAFHIVIPDEMERPAVRGDDDASKAHFIPFKAFKAKKAFADHWHVFQKFQRLKAERAEKATLPLAA
jgi:bifunctional NMN adenylyltransferase/nudix hydrolase